MVSLSSTGKGKKKKERKFTPAVRPRACAGLCAVELVCSMGCRIKCIARNHLIQPAGHTWEGVDTEVHDPGTFSKILRDQFAQLLKL
eukprot:scaffold145551_cov13-Tisochrysis_lutea.AAC.1